MTGLSPSSYVGRCRSVFLNTNERRDKVNYRGRFAHEKETQWIGLGRNSLACSIKCIKCIRSFFLQVITCTPPKKFILKVYTTKIIQSYHFSKKNSVLSPQISVTITFFHLGRWIDIIINCLLAINRKIEIWENNYLDVKGF